MNSVGPNTSTPGAAEKKDLPPSMVERMTLILDAFDGRASRLTLEEVACRTELPRSTVYRILDQLVRLNWVDHASFGYCLGRRSIGLGGGDNNHSQVRAAAAPLLHNLHVRTGMVVHLTVLDGGMSVYLDKLGGRGATAIPTRVGGRVPAHTSASGKAMLAWLDPEEVDRLLGERLERSTDTTISDITTLHRELNRIRQRRGLAFERGESVRGIGCVGAAVRTVEGPVAGISLSGDAGTVQLERVAPLVVDAVREVTKIMFPALENPRRRSLVPHAHESSWSTETLDQLLAVQSGHWL